MELADLQVSARLDLPSPHYNVGLNNASEHHSTRRKEPSWDPKGPIHRTFSRPRRTYPSPIGPFTFPQNDVEEYVGGPDAAVERVIAAFQDVLACVSCFAMTPSFLARAHVLFGFAGSTAIWTAT